MERIAELLQKHRVHDSRKGNHLKSQSGDDPELRVSRARRVASIWAPSTIKSFDTVPSKWNRASDHAAVYADLDL
ncbi:hypothetical protein [Streptomyces sp. NPDC016172]|uniref:hypothetical protein n=1 Tax=Streptomyces sp. NPDC016172 TaxID=3364964 RepID=UPI0036FFB9B2